MKCNHCSNEIPNDSAFCPFCGGRVTPAAPEAAPVFTPPVPEAAPTFTPPVFTTPNEAAFVPAGEPAQAPVYSAPAVETACPAAPAPEEKPKKNKLLPFIAIGAVAVVTAVVILLVTLLFGGKSPQDAAQNLIDNGNFTVVAKVAGEKMTIQVDLDFKKKDATIYAESGGEFAFAIYDGYYIAQEYDYWTGDFVLEATDISDSIEAFFESYEKADEADWEEVASMLEDMMGVDVEDYVDLKKFEKAMDTFEKNMENKRWLKKYAGYSTEREDGVKMHIYEPNVYKFANAVVEIFEDCFEDEDLYDTMIDGLEEAEDELEDKEVAVALGVKGKYLVNAEVEFEGVKVKISFDKIGSTKIDTDELEDMLDEAQDH